MSELKTIKEQVEYLLKTYPRLRDDDWLLIGTVFHHYYGLSYNERFLDVMKRHKDFGLPSFEAIRRTRQKVMAEHPEYESSAAKKKERQMAFNEFYEFAKS